MGAKPLRIRFHKTNGFMKIYGGIRYLVLHGYKRYNVIFDRVRYHIREKSGITDSINCNFGRIRIDLHDSLPIEKRLTFHNVVILIKSVANQNKNEDYRNIFLKIGSHKDKSNTQHF